MVVGLEADLRGCFLEAHVEEGLSGREGKSGGGGGARKVEEKGRAFYTFQEERNTTRHAADNAFISISLSSCSSR